MNVNDYLSKQYGNPPCWELVSDVYHTELGVGVNDYKTINPSIRAIADAFRLAIHKSRHGFYKLTAPQDFAVVLMGSERRGIHHCGIWYQGKVLHATDAGVFYDAPSVISDRYPLVEYWAK